MTWRDRGNDWLNGGVILFGELPIVGPLLWWAFCRWQRFM